MRWRPAAILLLPGSLLLASLALERARPDPAASSRAAIDARPALPVASASPGPRTDAPVSPRPAPGPAAAARARPVFVAQAEAPAGETAAARALREALASQDLYLATSVNGRDRGLLLPYRLRGEEMSAPVAQLRELGILLPRGGLPEWLPLREVPGLDYRYDPLRQAIDLLVPIQGLESQRYDAARERLQQPQRVPGAVLNYELLAQQDRSGDRSSTLYSGLLALRLFGRAGTLLQDGLLRSAEGLAGREEEALRLDTTWFRSDPERLQTWRLGDLIGGGSLGWTSPVRLGGAQWQRNFRLRPDLVTFPLPTLSGSAAVPSTLDLLVNNLRQYSRPVEAGPFVIENLPLVTGQGEIRMVLRDGLGREQVQVLPFYASAALLRPGLTDFSVEAGYLRRNFAQQSSDYDARPVALGSLRRGLHEALTIEGHAEGGRGLVHGGLGLALRLDRWGVVQGSLAASHASADAGDARGRQWQLGYQWFASRLGLSLSTRVRDRGYRTLSALGPEGVLAPRRQAQLVLSGSLGRVGLSAGYVAVSGHQDPTANRSDTRIATLSASTLLRSQLGLHATAFHEFSGDEQSGATVGLSYSFGGRRSLGAQVQWREHQPTVSRLQLGQQLPATGMGGGWSLQAAQGPDPVYAATAGYRFAALTLEGGLAGQEGQRNAYGVARGAVAALACDCAPQWANRIDSSFALVDTGMPHVAVLHENRYAGRSDENGLLLLPQLSALARNQIAIDPRDLAADVQVDSVRTVVVPDQLGGALVRFAARTVAAAAVRLQLADGRDVPLGAALTLNGQRQAIGTGYEGLAWLQGLLPHNRVEARWAGGECSAEFAYEASPGRQQQIGPLLCKVPPP